jgi:hypothetical protein
MDALLERMDAGFLDAYVATRGKPEEEAPKIQFFQVGEFLKQIGEPPPMLIQDMLPDKSLFLLTGKPKHLKSFMALDVGDAVARNVRVFGDFDVNRTGAVLYLAMEDGDIEVSKRCLQRGMNLESAHPLYLCTESFRIATVQSMEVLRDIIVPLNPVLLIIDTATEALGIKKWEDRAEVSEKLRPLREIIAREVCSVLLVAHNRKAEGDGGDEIAGTNGLTGAVDGWWSIYGKQTLPNGNVQLFFHREGRGGVRGDLAVEMDTNTLQMHTLTPEEVAKSKENARQQEIKSEQSLRYRQVAGVIVQCGGKASVPQIMRELEWDYQQTFRLVQEMVKAELLLDTGEKAASTGGRRSPLYQVAAEFLSLLPESIDSTNKERNPLADINVDKDFFDPPPRQPYKDDADDDEGDSEWKNA